MSDTPIENLSFEQALAEFEDVVNKLDGSQVALDDSIKLYERGVLLKAHCEAKLREAEEKVAKLTLSPDGSPTGLEKVETL